ncbi:NAD(P)-binding domain protein [Niveomyces insectorum RCEF 264]|uniref:NAD(P)-binding domain protein n=1 Tax=Niveomyces insectorum RCEF 264 TaxID=1081102 RepID=A0A167T737_9HYPO|nr:NAD(P)-binding domain protein [Niveomyces insectorum RCEF 264]
MDGPTTDFTKACYHNVYPAISPVRSELSQVGQNVLITGGGTNIGKVIAKSFAIASAKTVVIVGRRINVLTSAVAELQQAAEAAGSSTQFLARSCDVADSTMVNSLWDFLSAQRIHIDVLVLNAVRFTEPKQLVDLGIDEVWRQFEVNVKGPLHFTERFQKQSGRGQKFLLNVTTAAMHMLHNSMVATRPSYSLTKASITYAAQVIADSVKPEEIQVISFHPGMIYTDIWKSIGITQDQLPFDTLELAGGLAVWAASKESAFLHGRYIISNWDVDELAEGETKAHLEENPDYLRLAVIGLRGTDRA